MYKLKQLHSVDLNRRNGPGSNGTYTPKLFALVKLTVFLDMFHFKLKLPFLVKATIKRVK